MKKLFFLLFVVMAIAMHSHATVIKPDKLLDGKYMMHDADKRGGLANSYYYTTEVYGVTPGEKLTIRSEGNENASSMVMFAGWYSSIEPSLETFIEPALLLEGDLPLRTQQANGIYTITVPEGVSALAFCVMKEAFFVVTHPGEPLYYVPSELLSGTLPVMYITTADSAWITSKENYLQGSYYLDPNGVEGVEAIGSVNDQLPLQIKGRGNASWRERKKPYRIKLNKKQPLLGLKKNKHFCLMAHFEDQNAYQRDEMGFTLSKLMGLDWTPEQKPIELVINGDYRGLYWIAEKIRVDEDRVNIIEQDDEETDSELITGGWLLEIDNYMEDGQIYVDEGNGTTISFTPHSPEVLSANQREYITDLLNTINEHIYTSNKNDNSWEDYIDIDELVKFYVLQEILDNCESFSGSCFMHKERGDDTKLRFGPVWDFGSVASHWRADSYDYFIYEEVPHYVTNHWIEEIAKFPHFQRKVRELWHDVYPGIVDQMKQHCLDYVDYITPAIEADYERWYGEASTNTSYKKRRIWQILAQKWEFLNAEWKNPIPTCISTIDGSQESLVASIIYYDITGHVIKDYDVSHGVVIKVTKYHNGNTQVTKIMK